MKKFNLEHQYKLYLERSDLKESQMAPNQMIEMRRIFMGTCGQMLILLRDDLSELEEDKAIEQLENMLNQVGEFFRKESGQLN